MTIQRAREVLGKEGEKLTDKEIEAIRNSLYALSEILINQVISEDREKRKS